METDGHTCFKGFDIATVFLKNQYIRLCQTDQWDQQKNGYNDFIHAKN
jgi:hypothetical protein